jgi:Ca-activated chloride channel homolog
MMRACRAVAVTALCALLSTCGRSERKVDTTGEQAAEPVPPSASGAAAPMVEEEAEKKEMDMADEASRAVRRRSARGSAKKKSMASSGARARRAAPSGPIAGPIQKRDQKRPRPSSFNTEGYDHVVENPFMRVADDPLSTFSIDVDTASYANIRRMLKQGTAPPKGSVRIEEMINYFDYNYPIPDGNTPFSTSVEVAECPWQQAHLLAKIGLKGKPVATENRKAANLVFLLDVSGSMNSPQKLPLLIRSLKMAVNQLGQRDRVAIAVYAGASGLVLPSTPFSDRQRIIEAIDNLRAGGSTNAGEGIQLAYRVAEEHFIHGGINRVILATDGDFNVGLTSESALVNLITKMAKKGVFLTVLGLGMGNLKDNMLEKLADKGNGNYAYIDDFQEARKVFSEQINSTLVTIAKDVKIQVEFNPAHVDSYRLVGYENRMLAARDFNDDTKDAGEIGAGHTVTALYEIVPKGGSAGGGAPKVDPLKYQQARGMSENALSDELMTVKLRYKRPDGDTSSKLEFPVRAGHVPFASASEDFRFAAAVAGFGMLLRNSEYRGDLTFESVAAMASKARGRDDKGYRVELVRLIETAKDIVR